MPFINLKKVRDESQHQMNKRQESKIPLIRPHKRDTIPYVKVEQDETKRIPRKQKHKKKVVQDD